VSGYQTADRPRPVMSTGRPPMPVVPRWRVGRAVAVIKHPYVYPPAPDAPGRPIGALHSVVACIAAKHRVTFEDVMGPTRGSLAACHARREAMVAVAELRPCWSVSGVAEFFGRDLTTVLSAFKRAGHKRSPPPPCPRYPRAVATMAGEPAAIAPDRSMAGCRVIVAQIAKEHGVTFAEIMGQRRLKPVAAARKAAVIAVAAHMPRWTLAKIGEFFNRDHTTILHALGRLKRRRAA
jgi:chromosomal replication initiation ATPase DnaA